MMKFVLIFFLLYVFQIPVSSRVVRTNNNELRTCLSSSLPSSIRTIYPCDTLANQNSQCDHFNVSQLSSLKGGQIPHSPAVIVYVTSSNHVQNVIKCATKLDYIVNALSGGHSYEGYSLGSTDNNIVINLELINYININPSDETVRVGAGVRLGPIYYQLYQYNQYTINAGSCAWVGLAGQALGGGFGYLSRLYGLLSDQILELKAVNAQGELLTINETHETELFWALRGGGGGLFVIVTEFKLRLLKAPSLVTRFSSIWSANATKQVVQQYQSLFFNKQLANFSNNIFLSMGVSNINVEISILYFDTVLDEFNKTIARLLSILPTPNTVNIYEQDWLTFAYRVSDLDLSNNDLRSLLLENLTYPSYHFKAKHLFYDQPISDHSLDQFVQQLASGSGRIGLGVNPWDGYLSTIAVDQTAFPHRHFKFGIQFTTTWDDTENGQEQINWLNRVYLSVYNDSTKYSYINYIDRDVENWMNAYYHSHQQRLIDIKNTYDKNNRFYFERTIQSNNANQQVVFRYLLGSLLIFVSLIK